MEHELHQSDALYVLRFDVLDAGDVEEVILVVVGEIPLHLGWIHTPERLRDIDRRRAKLGKDVRLHPEDGNPGGEHDREHDDQDRDGSIQRYRHEPHAFSPRVDAVPPGSERFIRRSRLCAVLCPHALHSTSIHQGPRSAVWNRRPRILAARRVGPAGSTRTKRTLRRT